MDNAFKICVILAWLVIVTSAQSPPKQVTRFILEDSWDETLIGITHNLETSPISYDSTDYDDPL